MTADPAAGLTVAAPGGGYQSLASTDMSAALTAGVAALIRARYPWLTAAEVTQAIERGVTTAARRRRRTRPRPGWGHGELERRGGARRGRRHRRRSARARAVRAAGHRARRHAGQPRAPPTRRRPARPDPGHLLRSLVVDLAVAAGVLIACLIGAIALTRLRRRARAAQAARRRSPRRHGRATAPAAPATPGGQSRRRAPRLPAAARRQLAEHASRARLAEEPPGCMRPAPGTLAGRRRPLPCPAARQGNPPWPPAPCRARSPGALPVPLPAQRSPGARPRHAARPVGAVAGGLRHRARRGRTSAPWPVSKHRPDVRVESRPPPARSPAVDDDDGRRTRCQLQAA